MKDSYLSHSFPMPKDKSKSNAAEFFKAVALAIGLATVAYYKWANGLKNRKIAIGAMALPPILLLGLIVGSGSDSSQPSQPAVAGSDAPALIPAPAEPAEPNAPAPEATYPVTVTKTGLDFQNIFDGKMEVYPEKIVVTATWKPECGESASVSYQTQKFTFTLPNNSSKMKTVNEFSDCTNNAGTLNETDTYRIAPDGTIRVDLKEDDGSLIRENFIVITGGPAPQAAIEPEIEVVSVPEPEPSLYRNTKGAIAADSVTPNLGRVVILNIQSPS